METTVEKTLRLEDCPNAPKLDPRVRRTRRLLEEAMRSLLSERQYEEISVGDIAERATVNRATFYAHFLDKRDLAATLIREDLHQAMLSSLSPDLPLDGSSLTRLSTAIFKFMERTFSSCIKKSEEFGPVVGPTIQEGIESFLRNWLEMQPRGMRNFAGSKRDTVSMVLAWGIYGAAAEWSRAAHRPAAAKAAAEVVELLVRAS
jgi:AcrR family transcriptional regulator